MRLIALLTLCVASALAQGVYQITIPSGQAVSGELAIDPRVTGMSRSTAIALAMPSAWTAADLLVEASVDGSVYELRAAPQPVSEMRLSRSATGAWTFPAACLAPVVYRNGLRQWPSLDYSIEQGAVRFSDPQGDPSEPDDVVIAECR